MQIIRVSGVNGLGKTNGCEKAPIEVLNALEGIYSSEAGKLVDKKILDLEEIHLDNHNVREASDLIYRNAKNIFSEQDKSLFIGGDHSISYPLAKAFSGVFRNPFFIVFDAHADCMEPLEEPTHEEWVRALVERGFPAKNIVLVGTRNLWPEEKAFLGKNKIKVISMKDVQENRTEICDFLMERARDADAFYISVDIDVVDPAYAPGTGYPEPGGMSSRELIYFLQRLNLLKNLKAADIVEINPDKDDGKTVKLGARLLGELL